MGLLSEEIRKAIKLNEKSSNIYRSIFAGCSAFDLSEKNDEINDVLFEQECVLDDLISDLMFDVVGKSSDITFQPIKGVDEAIDYHQLIVEADATRAIDLLLKQRTSLYEALGEMTPVSDPSQIELFPEKTKA